MTFSAFILNDGGPEGGLGFFFFGFDVTILDPNFAIKDSSLKLNEFEVDEQATEDDIEDGFVISAELQEGGLGGPPIPAGDLVVGASEDGEEQDFAESNFDPQEMGVGVSNAGSAVADEGNTIVLSSYEQRFSQERIEDTPEPVATLGLLAAAGAMAGGTAVSKSLKKRQRNQ